MYKFFFCKNTENRVKSCEGERHFYGAKVSAHQALTGKVEKQTFTVARSSGSSDEKVLLGLQQPDTVGFPAWSSLKKTAAFLKHSF